MRTSTGLSTEAVYIFNNMVRKLQKTFKPVYMAAALESAGKTLREQEMATYKANRTETPPDLLEQIPYVLRLLKSMRIPMLECPGYEADDVIATIAAKVAASGTEVVIVSSDKDLLQLVTNRVAMLNPAKDDEWYDPAKVKQFMGVEPGQVADLLALKGDSVDNIPGAPGIGEKGAKDLLAQFGNIETLLERASEVQKKTYRESLMNNRDQVLLSKKLATVECNVPIEFTLEDFRTPEPDIPALKQIYKELEFHSALKELGPSEDTRTKDYRQGGDPSKWLGEMPSGAALAVAVRGAETDELGAGSVAFSWREGEAWVIDGPLLESVKAVLSDPGRPKMSADIKSDLLRLNSLGIEGAGFEDDLMLYAFLLDADPGACSLDALVQRKLDLKLSGALEQQADCIMELGPKLRGDVERRGLRPVYDRIDLPLTQVLARMERNGVRIDSDVLREIGARMDRDLDRLCSQIHEMAGKPFNVNSPQQLGKILFEDLGLPAPVRYGKGRTISTAADVLEELAPSYPIVALVLEFRQISKLKGTYVDALPELIRPSTGRLHTSFNQAGAATGRLSSSNPNLQNIPIRTEQGREIRAAFVPEPGWKLVVADYSQIELRLLAHMSKDPVLVESFVNGEDIHTRTAAEVFGIMPSMVTPDMRRNAKAVNFGIVYGISSFGLAQQLGIPRAEAEKYIRGYFARYTGVKTFIDETIAEVRKTGVTRTLYGRERPIPDINVRNPNARGFAERTAVNSPLQGTAADLIKLAMIRIDAELSRLGMESRMLLQVHDELVFEAPPGEVDDLRKLVKAEMEGVEKLAVPLVADTGVGNNWRDAK
jgi:DNA polymerase-1